MPLPAPRTLARYRLTAEQYLAMEAEQDGLCAICRLLGRECVHVTRYGLPLHVDHDHLCCGDHNREYTCGRCNRGLLCNGCNATLGLVEMGFGRSYELLIQRSPEWIPAARQYLAGYGVDLDDPDRRRVSRDRHVMRMAKQGIVCSCEPCQAPSSGG